MHTTESRKIQQAALSLLPLGFSVIPVNADKTAAVPWKEYQSSLMSASEVSRRFSNGRRLAIVAGAVSGNLECLDIDDQGLFKPVLDALEDYSPGLPAKLCQRRTPNGYHVLYKCQELVAGNQRLAMTADNKVRIETRGEGGYFLHSPSTGYEVILNSLKDCPVLTAAEVRAIHIIAGMFDERSDQEELPRKKQPGDGIRPGDTFNREHNAVDLLKNYGWKPARKTTAGMGYTRPGKKSGVSGVLLDPGNFYAWSTNAHPLEAGQSYSPFALYTLHEHGGDYQAAARVLAGKGYGSARTEQHDMVAKPDSPLPLVKKNEASDPFPFAALGPAMAAACEAIQKSIQAPDAIIAQSVLGAANLAVQGQRDIIIDGRVFPLSENLLSIAGTGERKSAVDNVALAKHREIEQANISTLASKQASYELVNAAYEHDKQALIKAPKKSLEEKKAGLKQLQAQAPVRPLDQTTLVTDFTFEGLFKLFQEGIPSKGLFADEGGQVTGGHGMRREAKLSTAAGLSKFWDGARVDRIRVLDGCSHLYGRRLAVHLMMQDDVGLGFYTDNVLKDQGLISRFLAAWPTSTVGKRKYNPVNVKDTAPMVAFYKKVSEAMHVELQYIEGSNGQELDPPKLPLSPEAKRIWIDLYNSIESESAPKGMLAPIRGFANKGAEHAARIAGTIQMFEHAGSTEIKADAMEYGIAAIEWYLNEALRITGSFAPDTYLLRAKEVLRWINDNDLQKVTLPDIYQLSPVRSASQARKVVSILKKHNHLLEPELGTDEKKETIKTRTGGLSKEWWTVHPESKESLNHD